MNLAPICLAMGISIVGAGSVCAAPVPPEAWLEPERAAVTPGATLGVELSVGEDFGVPGEARELPSVGESGGRLQAAPVTLSIVAGSGRWRMFATLPRPGVGVLWLELPPVHQAIAPEDVLRHLRKLHAPDDVLEAGEQNGTGTWREQRFVRLKTFVTVGEPDRADRLWTEPSAAGLDLVLETPPALLREQQPATVRVFRDGRPVVGEIVTAISRGVSREHVVVTDETGRATVILDAPGDWLLRVAAFRRESAQDAAWRLDVVAVTVSTVSR